MRSYAALVAPPTVAVLGIPLAQTDYAGAMDWMDACVAAGRAGSPGGYLTAAAVHLVMVCREDPAVRDAVLTASLVLPDGQPLAWAMRALGAPIRARVYGPELMDRYLARSTASGVRMYLYGGRDDAALALLARRLRERHPGLRIVGSHCPPFRPLTAAEERQVAEDIDASGADVVWVGIGQPKQELWMARMRPLLQAPLLAGVGAAFDFHAGLVAQAPAWMQRRGLEWAFRLSREPRRLWRRYARYNPRFIAAFARQYAEHLRARRDR